MKTPAIFGWTILIIASLLPALAWFLLKPVHTGLTPYGDITQSMGQLAGLTAMTLFAITFILSTRIRFIENIFGGLDKVYVVHSIVGATALGLIIFHPILLVLKYVPSRMDLAALYLSPSSHWSVNFGIIAILGLIALLYVTLYTKIKYHNWKLSHTFLGVVFIFAVFHVFSVRGDASRDSIFAGYYVFAAIVSFVGLSSYAYTLLIKKTGLQEAIYKVASITRKKQGVHELTLVPAYKAIRYKSGQFVFLRFYNKSLSAESHPFSLASRSDNPKIRVVIKDLGDFTSKMHDLEIGDKVAIEGPYGRFNYDARDACDQVWIAGGIGITPFIGMADDFLSQKELKCKIDLYYSVKAPEDFISYEYLRSIEKETTRFRFFPWVSATQGHLDARIIRNHTKQLNDKEFFVCGPQQFKSAISSGLVDLGVPKDKIHEEEFSFR